MRTLRCVIFFWCCNLIAFCWAEPPAGESKPKITGRTLEESPDVVERIRAAVENIGKTKTADMKLNSAQISSQIKARSGSSSSSHKPQAKIMPLAAMPPVMWGYGPQNGADRWGILNSEHRLCQTGLRQSPIHIVDADTLPLENMEKIGFEYWPVGGTLRHTGQTLQFDLPQNVLMNGMNDTPRLKVRGSEFRLTHLQFHAPAEEQINGQSFAMSMHLFHRNSLGEQAVVAVLLNVGEPSSVLANLWANIPLDEKERVQVAPGSIDLLGLLPADQRYYQYLGSLTTPPCTEGVLWLVLKQPISLSVAQLAVFTKLLPANARPVQAVNGRIIKSAQ